MESFVSLAHIRVNFLVSPVGTNDYAWAAKVLGSDMSRAIFSNGLIFSLEKLFGLLFVCSLCFVSVKLPHRGLCSK